MYRQTWYHQYLAEQYTIEHEAGWWKDNMVYILIGITLLGIDIRAISHFMQKHKVSKAEVENAMNDDDITQRMQEVLQKREQDALAKSIYDDAKKEAQEAKSATQATTIREKPDLSSEPQHKDLSNVNRIPNKVVIDDNFVRAVKAVEGSRSDDVSHAGASGVMQIMETTWKEINQEVFGGQYPYDEYRFEDDINILIGKAYLEKLAKMIENHRDKWQESQSDPYMLVLAAYNWGYGNVRKCNFDINVIKEKAPAVYDYAERGKNLIGAFASI
jgi:soluble lytic murein transglycosylase-like protein